MHYNANVHSLQQTRDWLDANDVHVMSWPAKVPYLNAVENFWGLLVQTVYKKGKQYGNPQELTNAISAAWLKICSNHIQKLENKQNSDSCLLLKKRAV